MPSMPTPPKVKLSHLRDIGWTFWDPIGLLGFGQRWDDADAQSFADEYDRYLVVTAGMLRRGAVDQDAVDYLVGIEINHMGLPDRPDVYNLA